ncbi:MAG: nucleotide-binding domain containing protein, partial [Vulcanisaeta sp.]
LNYILNLGIDFKIGKRIDSALRGNIKSEIEAIIEAENNGGSIILTDTIPEYGRFTDRGFTVVGDERTSIMNIFGSISTLIVDWRNLESIDKSQIKGKVVIVNSYDYEGINTIANYVFKNDLIPADPLPLISTVAWLYFNKPPKINPLSDYLRRHRNIEKICFFIGSTHRNSIRQINFAQSHGISVYSLNDVIYNKERIAKADGDVIIKFDYFKDRDLISRDVVDFLKHFDAIVLSGGETANYIVEISGGEYVRAVGEIMPLVGVGIIIGGELNGKIIVTKGGLIGGEDTYLKIIETIKGKR